MSVVDLVAGKVVVVRARVVHRVDHGYCHLAYIYVKLDSLGGVPCERLNFSSQLMETF